MSDREVDALRLKVQLQSLGLRAPGGLSARKGGAGPADGITLLIGDLVATVPTEAWYAARSPYEIRGGAGDEWSLLRDGEHITEIRVSGDPLFYGRVTSDGVAYDRIALRHGRDAIGSTVAQGCAHGQDACKFCAVSASARAGATVATKEPGQIAEVAAAAEAEGYTHVVLTTGSTGEDAGMEHLTACAGEVKARTGMRVHVQYEPPTDPGLIDLVASVSDSAAVNIECFDEHVLEKVAPGKAATGIERFEQCWERSVASYGRGQVTSFIILGLGESRQSVVEGTRLLTSLGVFPFILPLRPLSGTPLESWSPPAFDVTMDAFVAASELVLEAGLSASDCLAGCVRCGACTAFTDITA